VDCLIISQHYWPNSSALSSQAQLHPTITAALKRYQQAYADIKKPRQLTVHPFAGRVELELDFADGSSRRFIVNPIQVSCFELSSHESLTSSLPPLGLLDYVFPRRR